jgi:hypothetical protein
VFNALSIGQVGAQLYPGSLATVIWSSKADQGCDLGGRVVNGVVDAAAADDWLAVSRGRSLPKSDVAGPCLPASHRGIGEIGCVALLAEGAGELTAQPLILLGEFPVPVEGRVQPRQG